MATKVLSATVDENIARKLDNLARGTHRKRSYYVNQALTEYLEELEDKKTALSRRGGESIPLKQAKKELGL